MMEMNDAALQKEVIAFIGFDETVTSIFEESDFKGRKVVHFPNGYKLASDWETDGINIVAIVAYSEIMGPLGLSLVNDIKKQSFPAVPFFLVINHLNSNLRQLALTAGIVDVFTLPLKPKQVERRVNFTIENWTQLKKDLKQEVPTIKNIQFGKRLFDVFFAGSALLLLSPLFLVIYILVKLESKGPAFYYSLRVGTGYKVFKFYKFRSMFVNADQRIKDLKHLNQYAIDSANKAGDVTVSEFALCDQCASFGKCQYPMYADNIQWCEKDFRYSKRASAGSAFFKIKNDPRITKVGNFIRNTSIDELPQLWNVVIGNMSIVGNRPLPLYEAEKLTTDKYILRFSAPAGITGLWQVEKRGKGEMSEDERLMLDNVYAQTYSLKNDLKLILKTIPALFQKENV